TILIESGKQSTIDFEFNGGDVLRKLSNDKLKGYRFQPVYDSNENFYGGPRIDDPVEILQVFKRLKN
ncbi:uncharacterized protein METZ01_LOCUS505298, partial [marine metagenome]